MRPHSEAGRAPWATRAHDTQRGRRPYQRPVLAVLGDIRSLTLGGSPGLGDSGGSFVEKPFAYYGDYEELM